MVIRQRPMYKFDYADSEHDNQAQYILDQYCCFFISQFCFIISTLILLDLTIQLEPSSTATIPRHSTWVWNSLAFSQWSASELLPIFSFFLKFWNFLTQFWHHRNSSTSVKKTTLSLFSTTTVLVSRPGPL